MVLSFFFVSFGLLPFLFASNNNQQLFGTEFLTALSTLARRKDNRRRGSKLKLDSSVTVERSTRHRVAVLLPRMQWHHVNDGDDAAFLRIDSLDHIGSKKNW